MKFLIGKKMGMTQIYTEDGDAAAVTKISAGPCAVVQIKTGAKDGYSSVQFGYGEKKEKNLRKPQRGHLKGLAHFRYLREARLDKNKDADEHELKRGDVVDISMFSPGDKIEITATSKGKGFQGVVRRHGFHGGPKSHGHKDQLRMPGSIGAKGPAHVFKGTRMGGHMGSGRITVKNLEVIKIDIENNEIYIRGAVPGARNGLVIIRGEGMMKVRSLKSEVREEVKSDKEDEVENLKEKVEVKKEKESEQQTVNSEQGERKRKEE